MVNHTHGKFLKIGISITLADEINCEIKKSTEIHIKVTIKGKRYIQQ